MRIKVDIEPYQSKINEIGQECQQKMDKFFESDIVRACFFVENMEQLIARRVLRKSMLDLKHHYNGRISGVVRAYLSEVRIAIIKEIAHREKLDMTIHLANKLCLGLLDQSINTKLLKAKFATSGRTRSNGSKDFSRIEQLVEKYADKALATEQAHKEKIKDIKATEFMKIWIMLFSDYDLQLRYLERGNHIFS